MKSVFFVILLATVNFNCMPQKHDKSKLDSTGLGQSTKNKLASDEDKSLNDGGLTKCGNDSVNFTCDNKTMALCIETATSLTVQNMELESCPPAMVSIRCLGVELELEFKDGRNFSQQSAGNFSSPDECEAIRTKLKRDLAALRG